MYYDKYHDAAVLRGKTITEITQSGNDELRITTNDGKQYLMHHEQDCCESVVIRDITGDLQSLVGSPLVVASEETGGDWPADVERPEWLDSYTWTTYFFETATAKVRVRWLGESNGYYSESVQIVEL
jgi:hypothetical protein